MQDHSIGVFFFYRGSILRWSGGCLSRNIVLVCLFFPLILQDEVGFGSLIRAPIFRCLCAGSLWAPWLNTHHNQWRLSQQTFESYSLCAMVSFQVGFRFLMETGFWGCPNTPCLSSESLSDPVPCPSAPFKPHRSLKWHQLLVLRQLKSFCTFVQLNPPKNSQMWSSSVCIMGGPAAGCRQG